MQNFEPQAGTLRKSEYPMLGILFAMLLLYLTPFTTAWLSMGALVIELYRMIRFDAKVFATDYCLLAPLINLTRVTGNVAVILYLFLLAAVWYFVSDKIRSCGTLVVLIVMLNYLVARMQMDISAFVLCFGQMFIIYVLASKQDGESAQRAAKAFCVSLLYEPI